MRQDLYDYLDAVIMAQTTPNDAYTKMDVLATRHVDGLRKLTKQIQMARDSRDNEAIKVALMNYDEGLDGFIPVLMAMGKLFWDLERYSKVKQRIGSHGQCIHIHAFAKHSTLSVDRKTRCRSSGF